MGHGMIAITLSNNFSVFQPELFMQAFHGVVDGKLAWSKERM